MRIVINALRWAAGEAWEKINVLATWREIKGLGKKYGRRFVIGAVIWECIEDGLFPYLSWKAGMPQLIPLFLIFHFEPIVYPVMLWAFRTWDRYQGLEPWEPDRSAQSTNLRSLLKVLSFRTACLVPGTLLLVPLGLSLTLLAAYSLAMMAFGFVHERIWHDSNYGILPNDDVEHKRVIAKTLTYRATSAFIMVTALFAALGTTPWVTILTYQVAMLGIQGVVEHWWSHNRYGIQPTAAQV